MPQNNKSSFNVSCWLCDHFQRYDRATDQVVSCLGDCRLNPPLSWQAGDLGLDSVAYHFIWPLIVTPDVSRCGRFIRSNEQDIPELPALPCENRNAEDIKTEWDQFRQYPWNKKAGAGYVDDPANGISCYNCDHFNPLTALNPDAGECRAYPGRGWLELSAGGSTGFANGKQERLGYAHCHWCAQWEKTSHPAAPLEDYTCPEEIN